MAADRLVGHCHDGGLILEDVTGVDERTWIQRVFLMGINGLPCFAGIACNFLGNVSGVARLQTQDFSCSISL